MSETTSDPRAPHERPAGEYHPSEAERLRTTWVERFRLRLVTGDPELRRKLDSPGLEGQIATDWLRLFDVVPHDKSDDYFSRLLHNLDDRLHEVLTVAALEAWWAGYSAAVEHYAGACPVEGAWAPGEEGRPCAS